MEALNRAFTDRFMATDSENNKRIAKSTLLLYIRMIFMMAVSFYTSRVVLSILGIEDFGIYGVVGGVVSMFAFLNGVMSGVTQRYITFSLGKGNIKEVNKVFCTSINIHALLSLCILLLAETIGVWFLNAKLIIPVDRLLAANWVYQFSIISVIIMFMSSPYNAILVANERMSAFAYISVLEVVLKLLIVYVLLIGGIDKLILYSLLILFVQLFIRFIYSRYCSKHFIESHYKFVYDKALFKEILSFASWNLFGGVASMSCTQGLNIILNIFFGTIVNAARAVAVQVQAAITVFVSNFQMAINPQIVKTYAANEYARMLNLIFASSRYSFFLLYLIVLPFSLNIDVLLRLWLEEVPEHTNHFICLIVCIMLIDTLANPLMTGIQATGIIRKYQIVVSSIMVMVMPVSWFVLKSGKPAEYVFIVQFVISILAQLARVLLIKSLVPFPFYKYFKDVILKIIIVVITSLLIVLSLSQYCIGVNLVGAMLGGILSAIITVLCIFLLGVNRKERLFIKDKLKYLINK